MEQYYKRHGKWHDLELSLIILFASCRRAYGVCNSGHTPYWYLRQYAGIWKLYSQSPSQPLKVYGVWNSGHTPYWRSYPQSKYIEDLKVYGVSQLNNTPYFKDTQNMLSSSAIKISRIRRIFSWIRCIPAPPGNYKYNPYMGVFMIIHSSLSTTTEFHHSKAPISPKS